MGLKAIIKKIPGVKAILVKREIKKRKNAISSNGLVIIDEITKELRKNNANAFVDYGTLLGIARSKKLLSWDDDLDFGICINDEFTWDNLSQVMNGMGFNIRHEFKLDGKITEQNYYRDGISVDFFNHVDEGDTSVTYVYEKRTAVKYPSESDWNVMKLVTNAIGKVKEVELEDGLICTVPEDEARYMAWVYGDDWRIPNPNWVSGSGPAVTRLEDDVFGTIKMY